MKKIITLTLVAISAGVLGFAAVKDFFDSQVLENS